MTFFDPERPYWRAKGRIGENETNFDVIWPGLGGLFGSYGGRKKKSARRTGRRGSRVGKYTT